MVLGTATKERRRSIGRGQVDRIQREREKDFRACP
jgi:hypothetical protein